MQTAELAIDTTPPRSPALRALRILLAVAAVALAARLTMPVPGSSVPQSAQTLAVLLAGAWLGARDGAAALLAYVCVGALGLPVFSEGGAGWSHLVGPTGGYLLGFVLAAAGAGRAGDRGLVRRPLPAFLTFLAGHVLILAAGWAWLSASVGAAEALASGVTPFLWGGVVKSLVASLATVTAATVSSRARSS